MKEKLPSSTWKWGNGQLQKLVCSSALDKHGEYLEKFNKTFVYIAFSFLNRKLPYNLQDIKNDIFYCVVNNKGIWIWALKSCSYNVKESFISSYLRIFFQYLLWLHFISSRMVARNALPSEPEKWNWKTAKSNLGWKICIARQMVQYGKE